MKSGVLILVLTVATSVFSQKQVVFYDSLFTEVISNVQVFNQDHKFVGLSNNYGSLILVETDFPIEAKRVGYVATTIPSYQDTIELSPKFQEIEGVDIKPVHKMKLYNSIIESSNEIVDKRTSRLNGIYFESMLMIDGVSQDTIRIDKLCNMSIYKVGSKKKIKYTLFCDNASKSYAFTGTGNGTLSGVSSDTSNVANLLKIIPTFDNNLEYDLIKTKKYALKFEEREITRSVGESMSRMVFRGKGDYEKIVTVDYQKKVLHSWVNRVTRDRTYEGKGVYLNFTKSERQIEFNTTGTYGFSTIIDNAKVDLGMDGVLYEIYLVKGFLQDDSVRVTSTFEVEKMNDFFNSVNSSDGLARFYSFELIKIE